MLTIALSAQLAQGCGDGNACDSQEISTFRRTGGFKVSASRTTTRSVTRHTAPRASSHRGSWTTGGNQTSTGTRHSSYTGGSSSSGGRAYAGDSGADSTSPTHKGSRHYIDATCIASVATPCGFEDFVVTPPPADPAASAEAVPAAAPAPGEPAAVAPPAPVIDIVSVVNNAVSQVDLPLPRPHLGPEPSVNEWNMLAVGLPIWIWTDDTDTIDASVTEQGIPVMLVAHRVRTIVETGDGEEVICTTATPRPADAAPMAESPDCGHTWTTAGTYDVTATSIWAVEWSALGQAGLVTMHRSADRSVEVGELVSVVTR